MPQIGQIAHDFTRGFAIVRADPCHTLQFLAAAQVHGREAVLDQPLELRPGCVPTDEETAVGDSDPAQGVGTRGPRAAGARPGEQQQS
jgi:hypothetical protein